MSKYQIFSNSNSIVQIAFSVVDKKRDFTHGLFAKRKMYFNRHNCYGVMKRHLWNLDLRDLPEVYERHCLFIRKIWFVCWRQNCCLFTWIFDYEQRQMINLQKLVEGYFNESHALSPAMTHSAYCLVQKNLPSKAELV